MQCVKESDILSATKFVLHGQFKEKWTNAMLNKLNEVHYTVHPFVSVIEMKF